MRYAINSSFSRPHPSIIAQYRDLPVADICDALGRNAALPAALRPLGAARMLGTAYTVNLPASQNLLLYYAVDNARPGDVLVVSCAAYEDRAVCGEIMAHLALRSGLAGFVIDGAVRDARALSELSFPVYARAVTPNGPYKDACGEVNVPVGMGNVVITPGDIIVADDDGLVAVRAAEAETVAARAKKITDEGMKKLRRIEENGTLDFSWLYEKLDRSGCAIRGGR